MGGADYVQSTHNGLVGYTVPDQSTVTYTFQTFVNNALMPSSRAALVVEPR
jgi:hypothetical protein